MVLGQPDGLAVSAEHCSAVPSMGSPHCLSCDEDRAKHKTSAVLGIMKLRSPANEVAPRLQLRLPGAYAREWGMESARNDVYI